MTGSRLRRETELDYASVPIDEIADDEWDLDLTARCVVLVQDLLSKVYLPLQILSIIVVYLLPHKQVVEIRVRWLSNILIISISCGHLTDVLHSVSQFLISQVRCVSDLIRHPSKDVVLTVGNSNRQSEFFCGILIL
jgi:hypothetical protein